LGSGREEAEKRGKAAKLLRHSKRRNFKPLIVVPQPKGSSSGKVICGRSIKVDAGRGKVTGRWHAEKGVGERKREKLNNQQKGGERVFLLLQDIPRKGTKSRTSTWSTLNN